jgi:hemoglobin
MVRFIASILMFTLWPALGAAQTLSPRDVDGRLDNQLYQVLRVGTDLYNRGNTEACYRLYQGSLIGVVGFLDHRPDQAALIRRALDAAEAQQNFSERAFTLRKAIDDLRNTFKPVTSTLWDRLGGESGVTAIVDDYVNRTLANPRVNFTRRGTGREWEANPENVLKLKRALVQLVSAQTGGPQRYQGRDMKPLHQGMKITATEFNETVADLKAVLEQHRIATRDLDEVLKLVTGTKADIVEATAPTPPSNTITPPAPPQLPTTPPVRSLWDRLGGEPMVTQIVEHFTVQTLTNPKVNFSRSGTPKLWFATPDKVRLLRRRLVQMISAVTGGPIKYEGKDMKSVHEGMAITSEEFDAMVADLKASLEKFKIGEAEQVELIKIINGTKGDIVEKK